MPAAVTEQFISEFIVSGLGGFKSAMQEADGAMSQVEKSGSLVEKAFAGLQGVGKVALAGIGTAVGAVTGLGAAIAALAVDAAPLEGIERSFDGLVASIGMGSDEMLAALQQGSSGMVTQRDLMLSFNQAAALVGKDFAVQLPDAMQYLGKVSASTGQDVGFLLDSLVKGVGRLSPMILDNLDIQVNLAMATERAAEMYGVEESALSKAQLQAGMMAVALEKLEENTAAMPDVTQNAATKIAQLRTAFKDAKDQIGLAFVPILGRVIDTLLPALQGALPGVIQWIENFAEQLGFLVEYFRTVLTEGDGINGWLEELPAGIQPVVQFLGELIAGLQQAWGVLQSGQGLFAALMEVLDNFLPDETIERIWELYDLVAPVVESIISWVSENVKLQDVLIALGVAIGSVIIPAIAPLVGAIAGVIAVFAVVTAAVALLRTAWEENWGGIQEKAAAVWAFLSTYIPIAVEAVKTFVTNAITAIKDWWALNGDEILTKAQAVWQTIQLVVTTVVQAISDFVTMVVGAIRDFWAANGEQILATAQAVWNAVLLAISTVITTIQGIITTVVGAIQDFWQAHGDTIMTVAQNTWDTVKAGIDAALAVIKSIIAAFTAAIHGDWREFGAKLREATDAIWEYIKTAFTNAKASLVTIVSDLVSSIVRWFTEKDWGQIGRDIIQGIANGISAAASFIADAAKRAAQAALDAAKGFLGIESPSKVMFKEVGLPTGEGMALGIQAMIPTIQAQMQALVPQPLDVPVLTSQQVYYNQTNQYNLTTQSLTRPGGLRLEFEAMAAAGRIAA